MTKNIVICCDGTGNEIEENMSNVLKIFRLSKKDSKQIVYYDAGVGTIGKVSRLRRFKTKIRGVWGLATGAGLENNVLDAYRFLMDNYEAGDRVYLFGFSRGAYTVRVLAGFLKLVGLLKTAQHNMVDYAYTSYKQAAEKNNLSIAWRYQRVLDTEQVPIEFLGIWDTVNSVMVPRTDRLGFISFLRLPYTVKNPFVKICRHAMAIDERRRMFRVSRWDTQQQHQMNQFSSGNGVAQDIKQVWFAGVHSDVGGGYSEKDSGLAKHTLKWMVDEAENAGLIVRKKLYQHIVLGQVHHIGKTIYVAPDSTGKLHNSLTWKWWSLEIVPKLTQAREWVNRWSFIFIYFPFGEPRFIPENSDIHSSVLDRKKRMTEYDPINLPKKYNIEP